MKKLITPVFVALSAMMFLSGCAFSVGGGTRSRIENQTVGQQLIDLQKAKDAGAITDAEYQNKKAKLLAN